MSMKSLQGRLHPIHAMNAEQRQTAADPWTKPTELSHWPACIMAAKKLHPCTIAIYYYSAQKLM